MDIKIYVPCHQKSYVPESSIMIPIQVGTALQKERFENMLHDDDGDNISQKNRMYCELTAQYWAWKNQNSDYVGFFHYRRYLNFSPIHLEEDGWGNVEYKEPLNERILSELNMNDAKMAALITNYDVIVPKRRKLPDQETIQSQYAHAQGQHIKDLKCVLEVAAEKYPEYRNSIDEYLRSKEAYECNMFIMRRSLFEEYAAWLFDILFETEKRIDYSDYNQFELRVMGYLGERLFGIWYTHNKKYNDWKTLGLQKTLFRNTKKEGKILVRDDEVGIVMSCNHSFCPVMAVSIYSIVCNAKTDRNYKLYILNNDISEKYKAKIRRLETSNFYIQFINIGKKLMKDYHLHVDQHITVETYFRLFIPELFDCKKLLYLDCDMVVNDDVAKLYDQKVDGYYVAACRDIDAMGTMKCKKEIYQYIKHTIGCPIGTYFQAGVMLLNLDKIKKSFTTRKLLDIAGRKKWKFWDQDVLNYAFKGNVLYLPQRWNVLMDWENNTDSRMRVIRKAPFEYYSEYCEARKTPYIIHYAGYQKPWKEAECDMAEFFWKYAQNTPFYGVLIEQLIEAHGKVISSVSSEDNRVQDVRVDGLEVPIAIDGVMLKIINRFNRRFPIGSRRRDRLRAVMRRVVR